MDTKEKSWFSQKNSWFSHGLLFAIILAFAGCFIGLDKVSRGTVYNEVVWEYKEIYKQLLDSVAKLDSTAPSQAIAGKIGMISDSQFYATYWKNKIRIDIDSIRKPDACGERLSPFGNSNWLRLIVSDDSIFNKLSSYRLHLRFRQTRAPEFFARYPSMGIWALLVVVQLMFFFFLLPYAFFLLFTIPKDPQYRYWEWANGVQRIIYFLLIGVVVFLFYNFALADSKLDKPLYMMPTLDNVFSFVNAVGYLTIIALLAAALSAIPDINRYKDVNEPAAQQEILGIEKKVNNIFLITAVILSLGILTTGSLYNGLNSLPFVRNLNRDLGFNIFSSDAPFLYGCIHSCVLLLFFVPIRRMIAAIKTQVAQNIAVADAAATPGAVAVPAPSFDPGLVKKLTDLLIAGSPFLVGLLQSLFDILLK